MLFCRRKETYFRHLTKNSKAFVYALVTAAGSLPGFCGRREGLGSTPATTREGADLQPRCRVVQAAVVRGGTFLRENCQPRGWGRGSWLNHPGRTLAACR